MVRQKPDGLLRVLCAEYLTHSVRLVRPARKRYYSCGIGVDRVEQPRVDRPEVLMSHRQRNLISPPLRKQRLEIRYRIDRRDVVLKLIYIDRNRPPCPRRPLKHGRRKAMKENCPQKPDQR